MWWTADQGYMSWHKWIGVTLLALIAYRLVWGLIGPRSARLLSMIASPTKIYRYARTLLDKPYTPSLGHNPLGGLAVLALLGTITFQLVTGLFSVDVDGLASGWFGHLVSFETGRWFSDLHGVSFNVLLALIALHITAIILYTLMVDVDLIGPMITGDQTRPSVPEGYKPAQVSLSRFAIAIACAGITVMLVTNLGR